MSWSFVGRQTAANTVNGATTGTAAISGANYTGSAVNGGDLLVIAIPNTTGSAGGTTCSVAGFTALSNQANGGASTHDQFWVGYRVAAGARGSATTDSTFTVTFGATAWCEWDLIVLRTTVGVGAVTYTLHTQATYTTALPDATLSPAPGAGDLTIFGYGGQNSPLSGTENITGTGGSLSNFPTTCPTLSGNGGVYGMGWGTGVTAPGGATSGTAIDAMDFAIGVQESVVPPALPANPSRTWKRQFRHPQTLLSPPPVTILPPPPFIEPAGSRPRYPQLARRGQYFSPPWGQGNQGVPFPTFTRQPLSRRLTLRRSEGQFFSPGQFNRAAPQLPSFMRQATARRIIAVVRPSRGQFFNQAWGQGNQGVKFPLFMRQAGTASRWTLRRSHGTFFNQAWGQGNQGIQFPLYLRQAGNSSRDMLRRSQGRFANPGQFNLANQAYPSFTRQSGIMSRWTLRRSRGIFFNQSWGQGNQGVQFPLYLRQAQEKRLTLRRSEGNYFNPAQFNLVNQAYPSFTRQVQLSRETLRRSHGTFFNQAWGQANRGVAFPLFMRQAGNASRFTLRNPRGRFFPVTTSIPVVPPPQFITRQQRPVPLRVARGHFQAPGLGQANQGIQFPLFTRQAQLSRETLRRSSGKFYGVPVSFTQVPPPQFLRQAQLSREALRRSRGTFSGNVFPQANQGIQFPLFLRQDSRRIIRPPRGKFFSPGQFNLTGNPFPGFTRQSQRLTLRRSQGHWFNPGQFNEVAPGLPSFTRQAQSRRLGLRRSEGNYFSPGQFNLAAPQVPQFIRQNKRTLVRESHGQYFSIVAGVAAGTIPAQLSPRRPRLSPPRRGAQFYRVPPQFVAPVYPPDFRTTRRVLFTRLDGLRRGKIIQLVPFQQPSAPELNFRLGVPGLGWITGTPVSSVRRGE